MFPIARVLAAAYAATLFAACAPTQRDVTAPRAADNRHDGGFFAMNAITPYHHWMAGGEARANAVAAMQANLDTAKELGAESVRIDMWWHAIEPERGVWDWELTDQVVASMRERGIEPYPILCYHSAWAKDAASPADEEEQDAFAEYAGRVAKRYADDLYRYEVWNEPNIRPFWNPTPDAKDYARLLKKTYEAVKKADPDSMVVAMCTAGADYSFLEAVYREGAAEYCDAVSWHHYGNGYDEADIEGEIAGIRRIMERHGDGGKPLLLTEAGLSTGPSPVAAEVTRAQQASWTIKKHLVARANGVDRFYHFKLQDDRSETDPDGYWGMIAHDRQRKPLADAYEHLTSLLKGAEFLGHAWNAADAPQRRADAEVQVYRTAGGETVAAAWVRRDGDGMSIVLPSSGPAVVEDMFGNEIERVVPNDRGLATIGISSDVRYVRGLGEEARALVGTHFEPARLRIPPGRSANVVLSYDNPADSELVLDFRKLVSGPEDAGLSVGLEPPVMRIPPWTSGKVPVRVSLDARGAPFAVAELRENTGHRAAWRFVVERAAPFDVTVTAGGGNGVVELVSEVRNALSEPQRGTVTWRVNGLEQPGASLFGPIAPTQATSGGAFSFSPNEGENVVTCAATDDQGGTGTEILRVFGQERTAVPPVIDGTFVDWNDPPTVRMRRSKQSPEQRRDFPFGDDDAFKGDIRALWTDTHLYVGAEVTDSTPLVNPHQGTEVWRGDSLELYIGFPGPTDSTTYPPGFHQIVVSPGNGGEGGFAWNFKALDREAHPDGRAIPGAEVAASRTDDGYVLEAAIPLSEFGATAGEGSVIAFDMHLNNAFSPDSESGGAVLIWNGDSDDWRDPSDWGAAVILPDPADRPRTARGQLHGGETTIAVSASATRDPAFKTPLPVERPDDTAHLPEWLTLSLPFEGAREIATGYGFESDSWTHQTVGNARSANDFYCIDINMPEGTPIFAAAPGRVVQSNRRGDSYGHYVVIDHGGGWQSIYAHLSAREFDTDLGEPVVYVERGDLVGHSGQSGTSWPHLHFGVHQGARASHSGANVGGIAVCPEPLGGYFGIREGHVLGGE